MAHVEVGCVAAMDVFEGVGKRLCELRHNDQVYVVRHDAESEQGQVIVLASNAEQFEVDEAVGVGQEDVLAGIAALGYVVWHLRCDYTRKSSHQLLSQFRSRSSQGNVPSVPELYSVYYVSCLGV